ncbi:hypothetical protein [Ruminococcus sp.]|uniref:hypothetical protein n=1 Tax=Ruminococcus sp. TaxID=41978 RepID=UPI002582D8F6|nr:hypothetical protein [Ruminococcus sp.]MCR5021793.1 hypothetical protein [Ruminococcus sp.]
MKRKSYFRHKDQLDRNADDDYEFSEEYPAEEYELAKINSINSPYISLTCILLLILFTIFLIAMKLSGGKVISPQEAVSNFFMPLRSDYYEIRVDNTYGMTNKDEACVKFMKENGFTNNYKTSAFNRNTIMQLDQEDGKTCTLPGAYGSTTFYIKPHKADANLTIHIEYDVFGISKLEDGSLSKVSDISCLTDSEREKYESVDRLINGHILFFKDRNNGKYSNLIKDGKMIFRTSEHTDDLNENGEYKIKVYWVWAAYYEQMVNMQAEGALFDNNDHQDSIIEFIRDNPDEFFYDFDDKHIPNNTAITDYDVLSDYYDNADKLIVLNTNYLGFNVYTHTEK